MMGDATARQLDYANPKVFRSPVWTWLRRPTLPAKFTEACAVLSLLSLIPGLWMMHDFKFIRDYNPHWWQWVTPIAVPCALLLAIIAMVPSKAGFRRKTVSLALVGLVSSALTGAWAVLSPGGIVCGERADRIKCAVNLRYIGQALALYAQANHDAYPDDLATLVATIDIPADYFVCSMSRDQAASDDNIAAELRAGGHCSYTYFGKGLSTTQPSTDILAYETSPQNHDGMINILYGDGHVELDSAKVVMQKQTKAASQAATRETPRGRGG